LKVLHVIPAIAQRYGGPSYAVGALGKSLLDKGVDVVIATTDADGPGRLAVPLGEPTQWHGMPIHYFPRQCSEAFKYSRPMALWLREHVHDFDVVHVHAVFSHSSVAAYKACVEQKIRKWLFSVAWGRSMLSRAAGIHYSTTRERELVEDSLGLSGGFVVPIGIDVNSGWLRDRELSSQNRPISEMLPPYIIYVGRLDAIKNLELLVDVFDRVTNDPEFRDWRLIIGGDGSQEYVDRLRARVDAKEARKRICFVGWLSGAKKKDALAHAELFASFSTHESFGRSVAEAMSMGVPVVISDDVFVVDEVRRFEAGWAASGSFDEFARVLRSALSDRCERRRRGVEARRLAFEQLDVNHSAERMMARYEEIVDVNRCSHGQTT
jgi:glycosyltransferase involved in cell wall biosynthesis